MRGAIATPFVEVSVKQYKVMTMKDKLLPGRFDPEALEAALNSLAIEGWAVKGVATARVRSFAHREEMIIVLERDK
jgi:hypothetical protein